MRTIWKYELQLIDEPQEFDIPSWGPTCVLVDVQDGKLCMWHQVNTEARPLKRSFVVEGTGHPISDKARHIGSVSVPSFVWHVFEV